MSSAPLDNADAVRNTDKSDMLSSCVELPKHFEKAARLAKTIQVESREPCSIIVAGMGGSAIGGELFKDWARSRIAVPIEVCREYALPMYAGKNTLVFIVSYSGETEESLSVLLDAIKRKCQITCIGSGGSLLKYTEELNIPFLRVPSGIVAPRAALPYLFVPLLSFAEQIGLVSEVDIEVSETISVLKQVCKENSPTKPVSNNFAKTLASNIHDTILAVYGYGIYRSVAQRFKAELNENSKVPAKWEVFPELNHNEIVGWEEASKFAKLFSVIFIRDNDEDVGLKLRIEATKELVNRKHLRTFEVRCKGRSALAKMFSIICVGDFTSVYLAILRGIDPTPVKTITMLKDKLKQSGLKEKVLLELRKLKL